MNGTLRITILILGAITLLSVMVSGALIYFDKEVPDGLLALGSAGVGGLATMLNASSHKQT